ncbi:hypothetical protein [Nocardioides pantholopis]|nr:hypothetical protein [Nocardioides pantholopis]
MTAPTLEHSAAGGTGREADLLASVLLWTIPLLGFVLALLGLG